MPNATPYVLSAPRARHTPDLGTLTTLVNPQTVAVVLAQHGLVTERIRRLPLHLMVYFLLALGLFPSQSYRELQAELQGAWQLLGAGPWRKVTGSAISHARARLPWEVMRTLFIALAQPWAVTGDGLWRGFRLVAIDGSSMEVAASDLNEAAFGGPTGKKGRRVGYPQLRLLALVDCYTRILLGIVVARFARGESRLAAELVDLLEKGMLVLADRGFVGVELLHLILGAGAQVLWRVKKGVATRPLRVLDDGTYLAKIQASSHHGRGWISGNKPEPLIVRIIEFKLGDQTHRLLTTLLDPLEAPARELILLYATRWQVETFYRECKGNEHGRRRVLRSQTPNGVQQEIWAALIVHLLTRGLICLVFQHSDIHDPKAISFEHAMAFIKDYLQPGLRLSWRRLLNWAVAALTQPDAQLQSPPDARTNPRRLKARPGRYKHGTSRATTRLPFDPPSIELLPRSPA